jgi:hypothetical protein
MKEYWKEEITDICPGVMFKFSQTNSIDLITLVTDSIDYESANSSRKKQFVTQCLQQVIWSKNGVDWYPLVDADGNPRLPEFKDDPTIGFDLFSRFRSKVINPVFTESKTFQNLTKDFTESDKNTTSN